MTAKCGKCPATWSGSGLAHCRGCHRTFTTTTNFDRHRSGSKEGRPSGVCHNPEDVGLVANQRGQWGQPGRVEGVA